MRHFDDSAGECQRRFIDPLLKLLLRNVGTADIYKALQNPENEKSEKILHVTRRRHSW